MVLLDVEDDHNFNFEVFGAEGELIAPTDPAPGVARYREEARGECLRSPGFLGGLAGGRVRSRDSRGIPKKGACSLNSVTWL